MATGQQIFDDIQRKYHEIKSQQLFGVLNRDEPTLKFLEAYLLDSNRKDKDLPKSGEDFFCLLAIFFPALQRNDVDPQSDLATIQILNELLPESISVNTLLRHPLIEWQERGLFTPENWTRICEGNLPQGSNGKTKWLTGQAILRLFKIVYENKIGMLDLKWSSMAKKIKNYLLERPQIDFLEDVEVTFNLIGLLFSTTSVSSRTYKESLFYHSIIYSLGRDSNGNKGFEFSYQYSETPLFEFFNIFLKNFFNIPESWRLQNSQIKYPEIDAFQYLLDEDYFSWNNLAYIQKMRNPREGAFALLMLKTNQIELNEEMHKYIADSIAPNGIANILNCLKQANIDYEDKIALLKTQKNIFNLFVILDILREEKLLSKASFDILLKPENEGFLMNTPFIKLLQIFLRYEFQLTSVIWNNLLQYHQTMDDETCKICINTLSEFLDRIPYEQITFHIRFFYEILKPKNNILWKNKSFVSLFDKNGCFQTLFLQLGFTGEFYLPRLSKLFWSAVLECLRSEDSDLRIHNLKIISKLSWKIRYHDIWLTLFLENQLILSDPNLESQINSIPVKLLTREVLKKILNCYQHFNAHTRLKNDISTLLPSPEKMDSEDPNLNSVDTILNGQLIKNYLKIDIPDELTLNTFIPENLSFLSKFDNECKMFGVLSILEKSHCLTSLSRELMLNHAKVIKSDVLYKHVLCLYQSGLLTEDNFSVLFTSENHFFLNNEEWSESLSKISREELANILAGVSSCSENKLYEYVISLFAEKLSQKKLDEDEDDMSKNRIARINKLFKDNPMLLENNFIKKWLLACESEAFNNIEYILSILSDAQILNLDNIKKIYEKDRLRELFVNDNRILGLQIILRAFQESKRPIGQIFNELMQVENDFLLRNKTLHDFLAYYKYFHLNQTIWDRLKFFSQNGQFRKKIETLLKVVRICNHRLQMFLEILSLPENEYWLENERCLFLLQERDFQQLIQEIPPEKEVIQAIFLYCQDEFFLQKIKNLTLINRYLGSNSLLERKNNLIALLKLENGFLLTTDRLTIWFNYIPENQRTQEFWDGLFDCCKTPNPRRAIDTYIRQLLNLEGNAQSTHAPSVHLSVAISLDHLNDRYRLSAEDIYWQIEGVTGLKNFEKVMTFLSENSSVEVEGENWIDKVTPFFNLLFNQQEIYPWMPALLEDEDSEVSKKSSTVVAFTIQCLNYLASKTDDDKEKSDLTVLGLLISEISQFLYEEKLTIDEFNAAIRGLGRILRLCDGESREEQTQYSMAKVVALVWRGVLDNPLHLHSQHPLSARENFIQLLGRVQREYNRSGQEGDVTACVGGTINACVEALGGIHDDVIIILINNSIVSEWMLHYAKQIFNETYRQNAERRDVEFIQKVQDELMTDLWKDPKLKEWYENCLNETVKIVKERIQTEFKRGRFLPEKIAEMNEMDINPWIDVTLISFRKEKSMLISAKEDYDKKSKLVNDTTLALEEKYFLKLQEFINGAILSEKNYWSAANRSKLFQFPQADLALIEEFNCKVKEKNWIEAIQWLEINENFNQLMMGMFGRSLKNSFSTTTLSIEEKPFKCDDLTSLKECMRDYAIKQGHLAEDVFAKEQIQEWGESKGI